MRRSNNQASSSSPLPGAEVDTTKPIETSEQLRIAIDQGHGKVDATDPAAALLGTDDEAGGASNTAAEVRLAASHEIRGSDKRQRNTGIGAAWWLIAICVSIGVSIGMSVYGIPEIDIARVVSIDPKTLRKHYRDELDMGETKANAQVAGYLFNSAKNGNVTAQIYWLKTRAKWRETPVELRHSGAIARRSSIPTPNS
jgi:hypothetical protein